MNKRIKFSVILIMAVSLLLFFCGCEDGAVSYSAAEEALNEDESGNSLSSGDGGSSDAGSPGEEEKSEISDEDTKEEEPVQIQVYVCGAVKEPGVYKLPAGSRVHEAVAMAGGLLDTADRKALNQARLLADGEQVTVLTVDEVESGLTGETMEVPVQNGMTETSRQKVNINTADENALMTIPGIGESRARAIIAYREENGKFESVEEIMKIDGIKEKMFEKIRDSITV